MKRSQQWVTQSAEKRFAKLVKPGPLPDRHPELGPCLIYAGAKSNGYGQFQWNGKRNGYAHRYAWERVNGPIPEGMTVDHLCYVRACVNVEHLELTDLLTNYLRGVQQRTHCPNGHLYPDGEVAGKRRCRECLRAGQQRAYARLREGLPDGRVKYDQVAVSAIVENVRSGNISIAQGARDAGCNQNYLGRRVWMETKKIAMARDGHTCWRCLGEAIDVHHRIVRGKSNGRDPLVAYGIANLVCLCRTCHDWVHAHPAESYENGYLVHSWQKPEDVPIVLRQSVLLKLFTDGSIEQSGACEPIF